MTTRPIKKTITLTYGLFAGVLLITLVVGVFSGTLLSGLASFGVGRQAPLGADLAGANDRPWIGITYMPLTSALAHSLNLPATNGALIVAVTPASPADRIGLRENDIITAVDERVIDETTGLLELIAAKKVGDTITTTYIRAGSEQTSQMVIERMPARTATRGQSTLGRWRSELERLVAGR